MGKFKIGDRVKYNDRFVKGEGIVHQAIDDETHDFLVKVDPKDHHFAYYISDTCRMFSAGDLELVPALQIEAGKFYKTRDGRKVGPMTWHYGVDGWIISIGDGSAWNKDGTVRDLAVIRSDIVAEWVDETVVANDNPAPAQPKFKVGDLVKITHTDYPDHLPVGSIHAVVDVDEDGFELASSAGDLYFYHNEAIPAPTDPAIVCLIEDGQPKPSNFPHVHADEGAASREASRLASVHKGRQFGVFVLTQTVSEEKVYAHEWQRLAAKGEKIASIKALKAANDLTLKGAKDAVEHWLATAA